MFKHFGFAIEKTVPLMANRAEFIARPFSEWCSMNA
jgi:hypothetical protein